MKSGRSLQGKKITLACIDSETCVGKVSVRAKYKKTVCIFWTIYRNTAWAFTENEWKKLFENDWAFTFLVVANRRGLIESRGKCEREKRKSGKTEAIDRWWLKLTKSNAYVKLV